MHRILELIANGLHFVEYDITGEYDWKPTARAFLTLRSKRTAMRRVAIVKNKRSEKNGELRKYSFLHSVSAFLFDNFSSNEFF